MSFASYRYHVSFTRTHVYHPPIYTRTALTSADWVCPSGAPCDIDCDHDTDITCQDSIIDGSLASELTITCASRSICANMSAICPTAPSNISASASCSVTCTASQSCSGLRITSTNSSTPSSTLLACAAKDSDQWDVCADIELDLTGDVNATTIACHVDIQLDPNNRLTRVCSDISLATNASTVSLRCTHRALCEGVTLNSTNAQLLSVQVDGTLATSRVTAMNVAQVKIDVVGVYGASVVSDSYFFADMDGIYIPTHRNFLTCVL